MLFYAFLGVMRASFFSFKKLMIPLGGNVKLVKSVLTSVLSEWVWGALFQPRTEASTQSLVVILKVNKSWKWLKGLS